MAAAPLYQQIMSVPGLTGTWQQRLSQYYKALTGRSYTGTRDQGIYMLGQIAKGNYPQTSAQTQAAVTPAESAGTIAGREAGTAAALTPFGQVLPWEQYFPTELAQGAAEQAYANYYAPIVQKAQEELESGYAGRGLTRSGLRSGAVGDLYRQYGQEQQAGVEADVLQQKAWAKEEYNKMQNLYEESEGKQKPAATTYTPYKVAKPKTAAGTYGSSYLDWLNRATRV